MARDGSAALVFDYDLLGKGYVYGDLRNVCSSLGEKAREAFLAAYGPFDEKEIAVDTVVSELIALHYACQKKNPPRYAQGVLDALRGWEEEDLLLFL